MWSSGSGFRCFFCRCRGGARICCCTPVKLALRCCCSCRCLVLSIDGPHLIQAAVLPHLLCNLLPCKVNVQEVLPDAGSTTYKDMLAVLPPSAGAACLSAQWLWHDPTPSPLL